MRKIAQKILTIMLCLSFCGLFLVHTADADSFKLVSELFIPSGVVIEPVKSDSSLSFNEEGIRITSRNLGEKLSFKDTFSGEFLLDYTPDKEDGEFSFREFSVVITDANSGELIKIGVSHGEYFNVSVTSRGQKAGIFYPSYGKSGGLTQICNEDGIFTRLATDRLILSFNPETMSVYAGEKGVESSLVWSFADQINDGRDIGFTLDSFIQYTVDFEFADYLSDEGTIILYSVNNCALDNLILSNKTQPSIYVPFEKDAVVGEKYVLPTPTAFDLYYGNVNNISNEIFAPDGTSLGKNLAYFTPSIATADGKGYTIFYKATNANGVVAEKEYSLKAYASVPDYDVSLNWNNDESYLVGSIVYVPEGTVRGGLLKGGAQKATVTIKKNNVPIKAYTNVESGFYFTLNTLGEYCFSYNLGETSLDYSIKALSAENAIIADGLKSVYSKGELIDVSDVKVKINGEFVDYSLIVKYPDGSYYSNKKFIAEQMGEYVLTATAVVGENAYNLEKKISVHTKAADLFASDYEGFVADYDTSRYTGRSGVKLSTSQSGAIMEYTQEIDLDNFHNQTAKDEKGYTVLSETATPIIDMSLEPTSYGVSSSSRFYIYITDVNDPTNKLTIIGEPKGNSWWTYIRANAPAQKNVGFYNGGNTVVLNNATGRLDASYGFMTAHSFKGGLMTSGSYEYTTADSKVELFYDADEKQLLTHPQGGSSNRNHIIMDFDDPLYCEGMVWNGFSSNKVKISIALTGLNGTGSMFVYSVGGRAFTEEMLNYDIAPQIVVDIDDGAVIEGMKGKEIKVPSVSATDKFGSKIDKIITKIYYDYEGTRLDVSLKNGKFSTARVGNYYIVYTATDLFGNQSEKVIPVTVQDSDIADINVRINSVASDRKEGKTLDKIVIGADDVSVSNMVGETTCEIKLYLIDGNQKIEKEILTSEINGQESFLYFVPDKEGVYHVEYHYTDSVLRKGMDYYQVNVQNPVTPIIVGELPYYAGFIRGNNYDIAIVNYIDYSKADAQIENASVYINGKLYTENTVIFDYCTESHQDNAVCDKVHIEEQNQTEQIEMVLLEYRAGDYVLCSYELPVKNVKKYIERQTPNGTIKKEARILYDRYFVANGGMTVAQSTGSSAYLLLTTQNGQGNATFAQPLSSSNPTLKLDVNFEKDSALVAQKTTLKGFYITLTDAHDSSKSVTVYVYNEENVNVSEDSESRHSTIMKVNGIKSLPFTGSLVGKSADALTIGYRNDTMAFYDQANESPVKLLNVNYYDDGTTFEGFSSLVYVSLKLDSDQEQASLRLYSISGHSISNTDSKDLAKPIISVNGSTSGIYSVGDKVKVLSATASDVLSYVVDGSLVVTVTVKSGGKESVVVDVNGKPLDKVDATVEYEILLSEMGTYNFTYSVSDSAGNVGEFKYALKTINRTKPQIKLDGEVPKTIAFGKEIKIPNATVEFMEENEQNVYYALIIAPNGSFSIVKDNKFIAKEAGVYTLRYYALDAYGNFELLEYDLLCK